MDEARRADIARYQRQMSFAPLGPGGQRAIGAGRVLIVGVGGLGTWAAELLARAGVGMFRLVDDDRVDLTNIHRQSLYDQADVDAGAAKASAAAKRIGLINPGACVEPIVARLDGSNVAELADGVDVILDGTDNFPTRFVINDYAVKAGVPWIFAGAVGAEGQTQTIVPQRTACLRCIYDAPPPPCADPTCRSAGVLPPTVATIAAIQACEAIKILAGKLDAISTSLLKLDLWDNQVQRIDCAVPRADCPCCQKRQFEFLEEL